MSAQPFDYALAVLQYVSEASQQYLQSFRRYNYTTPKSYLELIALYKCLLARKRAELQAAKERLQNGVEKIAQASAQVIPLAAHAAAGCSLPSAVQGTPASPIHFVFFNCTTPKSCTMAPAQHSFTL